MGILIHFDRIPPGRIIGPHRHPAETVVYVAAGEIVFEYGDGLDRRTVVGPGDVLYEAADGYHRVRNDGRIDALCLLATADPADAPGRRVLALDHRSPVRRRDRARIAHEGEIVQSVIARSGDLPSDTFMVSEVVIPPGVTSDWHRHPGTEQVLVVLAGRGQITVEDASEVLEPLTGIRVAAGATHRVSASGRQSLRYVVIASPGLDPDRDRRPAAAPERQVEG